MSVQQLPRLVTRSSLVLAPLAHLASALAVASLATGTAGEVAAIARHPDRYYAFTLLQLVAVVLFVPMLSGLMQLTRAATPFLGIVGAGLTLIGTFVGIADAGTQLVYWQMGTGNQVAMIALAHRFENATGATAIFMAGGISLMAGSILLALALWRSRVAPAWAAACLPVGLIGTVAAFASASRPGLVAASVAMLVGLGAIALRPGPLAVPAVASAV